MSFLDKLQEKYAAHQAGGDVITAGIKNAEKFLLVATVLALSRSFVRHCDHHNYPDLQRSSRSVTHTNERRISVGFNERNLHFCQCDGIGPGHNHRSRSCGCVVRRKSFPLVS